MTMPVFRGRALVSTMMACGFMGLVSSGLVLYASPSGRAARDLNWGFLSLDKWEWRDLHLTFGLLFFLTGLFHLWLNITPLVNYVRQRFVEQATQSVSFRWRLEPMLALSFVVLLVIFSVKGLPPVSYIVDLRDFLMDYWTSASRTGD